MAVTFNGPLKISRPGYTVDGITPNNTTVPNRQAWQAAVPVATLTDLSSAISAGAIASTNIGVIPAGSLLLAVNVYTYGQTAAFTNALSMGLSIGGTNAVSFNAPSADVFLTPNVLFGLPNSDTQKAIWLNTGINDNVMAFSCTNLPAGTSDLLIAIQYIPRNTDGSLSDEGYRPFTQ